MAFIIPVDGSADNIQRIQIGTETYDFRFRWNSTECAWYCYLGLNGDDPKVKFKLVVGMDLLEQYVAYAEVPPGILYVIDIEEETGRVTRNGFGIDKRFQLFYADRDEDLSAFFEEG